MRAVRNTERGIEIIDTADPTGDGALVHIRSAGICGSDLKLIEVGPTPVTLGHELAGVLDDGTPVAVEPLLPCGDCDQCTAGSYGRCRRGGAIFVGLAADGGMADAMLVPERALVRLAPGVRVEDACIVEPLAVAQRGLRVIGAERGMRVAVVGGGTIGLAAVAVARAVGCDVALIARHDHQRVAGERLGAGPPFSEYDVVVEAGGTESAMASATELAAPGATVLVLSTYWGPMVVPGVVALVKELRIESSIVYGAHGKTRDIDDAAALLAAQPQLADALITHRFPLAEAPEAFRVARDRAAGAIKVVLEP